MHIYIKFLTLLYFSCLIEDSVYPIDTRGVEHGYWNKFLPIGQFALENDIIEIDDYFDEPTGIGKITIKSRNSTSHHCYNLLSNQAFIIDGNGSCRAMRLFKKKIVQQWARRSDINISEGALGPSAFLMQKDNSFLSKNLLQNGSLPFHTDQLLPYGFGCIKTLNDNLTYIDPSDAKVDRNYGYHFKFFPISEFIRNYSKLVVDDYFDGSTERGRIIITRKDDTFQCFYDSRLNEAFIIDGNNRCQSHILNWELKKYIVNQWAYPVPVDRSISGGALGPGMFLVEADGTFRGGEAIGLKTDWYFEKLMFKPGLHRPYGFGCKRSLNDNQTVPKLAIESTSFTLKMEANLYHNSIDSIDMIKHNGIISYDVSGDPPLRIIHIPSLLIDYIIDRSTGQCRSKESILVKGSYLRWPYDTKYSYNNLLSPSLMKLERQRLNYFGTERIESSDYEVFEKTVNDFWIKDNANGTVIITYFIPTEKAIKKPIKIRILYNNLIDPKEYWITYQENTNAFTNDPSRFDLRNCFYTEPTWFQIVFPVVPRAVFSYKYLEYFMETELRDKLDFIPINRLPVIKVGHYGPSIYVTFGLLEGVDVRTKYINQTLSFEPNVITIEDNSEDCSFLCSDSPECDAFSYCNNGRCNLFTVNLPQMPLPNITANCILFVSRTLDIESDMKMDQLNQIASTSKLIHKTNLMIQQQELNVEIKGISINAEHLFIVSHPDELGGYGEMYRDVIRQRIQLNDYKIIMDSYELIGDIKLFDLSHLDCLTYCQNDNNCSTVSYCTTRNGECITSYLSADELMANPDKYAEFNDHCSILSKSYLGNFKLLSGKNLEKPVLREIEGKSPEECAKSCIDERSFACDSFDYCKQDLINSHCFFYMFHSYNDVLRKELSQVWNNDEESCNHYSRKLSKEYSQFIGKKLTEHDSIIATIEENSLENCASSCNSNQGNCFSFEYCQFTDQNNSQIQRRCRLSSSPILTQDEHTQKTNDFCSVYSILKNNDNVQRLLPFHPELIQDKMHPHFYLTLFTGFIAVLAGTIISAFLTSLFLAKKRS